MIHHFHKRTRILISKLIILFVIGLNAQTAYNHGVVVSDHQLASDIGLSILKQGGNAIDASIATAFALAVCYPAAGNIGGGGFLVYMDPEGSTTSIDFREKAPMAAHERMFQDAGGKLIEGSNHKGLKSVGVPGTVAGLFLAHQKYGKLPWSKLVQPAIELADNGFLLTKGLMWDAEMFQMDPRATPFIKAYFSNQGRPISANELWQQKALANTLKMIRDNGHDGFYKGIMATMIADFMRANGGLINEQDLTEYQAIERKPIHGTYRTYDIYSMGPPSSGGVTLVEMLNMLENVHLDSLSFDSVNYLHLLSEIMRRAYADRAQFLGDPDFNSDMPVDKLISKDHGRNRFRSIDWTKASVSDSAVYAQVYEGDHTTHFSVIDRDGAAVSLTYTLEESYGSQLGSAELGFIFNNEMGDFNPVEGPSRTNGLIGSSPNLIEPGKRMLSSMSPTIIAKDGKPVLIVGSPGGRTIINTVFQTIVGLLDYNLSLDSAIESLKIHHQWLPDRIVYESSKIDDEILKGLKAKGHRLLPVKRLGNLMAITMDPLTGEYKAWSDSASPDGGVSAY